MCAVWLYVYEVLEQAELIHSDPSQTSSCLGRIWSWIQSDKGVWGGNGDRDVLYLNYDDD